MPRTKKYRKVCSMHQNNRFGPLSMSEDKEIKHINLTIDEYEVIRL